MMKIRKALNLDIAVSELIALANNTQCVITDELSVAQVKSVIDNYQFGEWLKIEWN